MVLQPCSNALKG